MKRFALLVVLMLLVGLPGLAHGSLAQDETTVTVSVTDPAGEAVQGAALTASWDDGSTTATTASNGKAFVDVPAGAAVTIEAGHEEYVRNRPYEIAAASEETVDVTVHPKASAVVRVATADAPVEGADVVVRKNGTVAVTGSTDEDGVFETGVIEQGEYTMSITKPGYFDERINASVEGNVETSATLEQGSVTVSFNVTDDHFQSPKAVDGAEVRVADVGMIKTRDNGQAAMNLPVNSEFELTVDKEGYDGVDTSVAIAERPKEIDFTIERTPGIYIETVNRKVVTGERSRVQITNSYGEPVADATVSLDDDEVGETNADGVITVPIETSGDHAISASKGDLRSESVTVQAFSTEREKQQEQGDEDSAGIAELGTQLVKQALDALLDRLG